jgi:hypothetical protein
MSAAVFEAGRGPQRCLHTPCILLKLVDGTALLGVQELHCL